MKRPHLNGSLCVLLSTLTAMSAHAALIGVLPATPNGTDWQAYYDDQLDITWAANANINGLNPWDSQVTWVSGLNINNVTGWRLPSMDLNGDNNIVNCASDTHAACMDNEYGHLFYYGAGTTLGGGITFASPSPFSNIQSTAYYSGTNDLVSAHIFNTGNGTQGVTFKSQSLPAWAVHTGNVSTVPVPAAAWLFGSGLMGFLGLVRRKR